MSDNKNPKRILMVAAHPDDEILGAGGTMAKHADQGDIVHVVICATGAASRYTSTNSGDAQVSSEIDELRKCANAAAKALGTQAPIFLDFPDNQLDSITLLELVHKIEPIVNKINPHIVYTHNGGDLNVDHEMVHRATITSTRPLPGSNIEAIYTFETLSSTEWSSAQQQFPFVPNRFVDISMHFEKKMAALKCYDAEMRPFPHPRSYEAVEALAKLRGAVSGMEKAESFSVFRQVIK